MLNILNVGAAIGRPRGRIVVFALAFGEYAGLYCADEQCSPLQWYRESLSPSYFNSV